MMVIMMIVVMVVLIVLPFDALYDELNMPGRDTATVLSSNV